MPLPRRPSTYILGLLLLLLAALVWVMFRIVSSPEVQTAAKAKSQQTAPERPSPGITSLPLPPAPGTQQPPPPVFIDPMHKEKADLLHNPGRTPQQDLEIVQEFLDLYGRAFGQNPIGENSDITAALTGENGQKGRVFPPGHRAIRDGQLVDRWGTSFWFHPNSGKQMEIRSAGPDKQMFTTDDLVLNPSPAGLGVTPLASPQ